MRIQVDSLVAGDCLLHNTFNSLGLHVCSAGKILNAEDISMLVKHHIEYVDVAPGQGHPHSSHENAVNQSNEQAQAFSAAIDGIKTLFDTAQLEGIVRDQDVNAAFNPLIESLDEHNDVVSLLLTLNSKDDYTCQHSVQVGMLSYYIAKWLGKSETEALLIGKAGYLHDIGKSRIDNSILKKPDRLTGQEYNEIKKHTIYGYEIIRNSLGDPSLSLTALQHHERLDGKGYPLGKKGGEIHSYAKIVAVADVYSAMICSRVYQHKRDLLVVLKELHRMSFGELDPQAAHSLIKNMIPNFIGKKITLSDGREGLIVMTNPSDYFHPLIRIDDQFIDLSHDQRFEIVSISM